MAHNRDLFGRRLHALRKLDDALERGITVYHALKQFAEDALDLTIDQIVDVEFIEPVRALQLPGAGSADHDLRPIFFDDGMRDDLQEFSSVDGNQVLAGDL